MSRKEKRIKPNFENLRSARAELNNVWISPQKTRLVANLIRNKSLVEANTNPYLHQKEGSRSVIGSC